MAVGCYDWRDCLDESNKYQKRVMDFLRKAGKRVEDKTTDPLSQSQEIDFVCNGEPMEFKSCNQIHKTGNVAFEIVSNTRKGTPGACLYSKAHYLCYFDTVKARCYFIDLPALRSAIERCSQTVWKAYKVCTRVRDNGVLYATIGLLVPLDFIRKNTDLVCLDIGFLS